MYVQLVLLARWRTLARRRSGGGGGGLYIVRGAIYVYCKPVYMGGGYYIVSQYGKVGGGVSQYRRGAVYIVSQYGRGAVYIVSQYGRGAV